MTHGGYGGGQPDPFGPDPFGGPPSTQGYSPPPVTQGFSPGQGFPPPSGTPQRRSQHVGDLVDRVRVRVRPGRCGPGPCGALPDQTARSAWSGTRDSRAHPVVRDHRARSHRAADLAGDRQQFQVAVGARFNHGDADDDGAAAPPPRTTVITPPPAQRPTVRVEQLRVGDCVEVQQTQPDPTKGPDTNVILIFPVRCEVRDGVFRVDQILSTDSCPVQALFNRQETIFACISSYRG